MSRAPQHTPSDWQMQNALRALLEARQQLAELDPSYLEDERLVADHLEAEAGNAFDVLYQMARAAVEARSMAEAADQRAKEIQGRRDRYKRREEVSRAGVQNAMEALGLTRINLPDLDVTIATPAQRAVVITDEAAIREPYVRVVTTPDKAAIREALLRGDTVDGATLSNPKPSLRLKAT